MTIPLEVKFQRREHSRLFMERCREGVRLLAPYALRINSCTVSIDNGPGRNLDGHEVEVCVDVRGADGDVFIDRTRVCHGERDIGEAIHEAFRRIVHKLENLSWRSNENLSSTAASNAEPKSEGMYFG